MEGLKKLRLAALLLACLAPLLLAGCMSEKESAVAAESEVKTEKEVDKFIEAFGRVKAEKVRNFNLDFRAEVTKLHVKKGQKVKRGDTLVTLDLGDFTMLTNEKEYDLLESDLEVERLSTESYNSKSGIAKLKVKRRDNLNFELEELESKRARLNLQGNRISCDLEEGIVSDIGYAAGDIITHEKNLISIIDTASIIVEADVPEEFIKDIKTGCVVDIIPVADNKRVYKGKVLRMSNIATERNGETVVTVDIAIDDRDDFLLPNYNVDVKIYSAVEEQKAG